MIESVIKEMIAALIFLKRLPRENTFFVKHMHKPAVFEKGEDRFRDCELSALLYVTYACSNNKA
jgi:hypothetical protein